MTLFEGLVAVLIAIVGPGGIIVMRNNVRMQRKADEVARSVGPVNGAGTIQQQLQTIATTLETLSISDRHTISRLDSLEDTVGGNTTRISALEAWQRQFGVDTDDRFNEPSEPTKEAS